jgi:predicted RNA-binding Zn-ribbon protein involved in translation (DUF1610 family)
MIESRSSNNFKCPKCGAKNGSDVTDSRGCEKWIRRRRKCNACGERFTTREMVWNDDPDDPNAIKPADVLNLRAIALDIIQRTEITMPRISSGNNSPHSLPVTL